MEREFIYIDDVVDAYVDLGKLEEYSPGEAFNIGGTGPNKIVDVVKDTSSSTKYDKIRKKVEKQTKRKKGDGNLDIKISGSCEIVKNLLSS